MADTRYDLAKSEYAKGEQDLAELIRSNNGDTVCTVWIAPNQSQANLVRTAEATAFPEIPAIMRPYESVSAFLAIFDTRPEKGRIVHAFRISTPVRSATLGPEIRIGIALIDDLLASDQGLNRASFLGHCQETGLDLNMCLSVETNFRIGQEAESYNGLPISQIGYLAIFQRLQRQGVSEGNGAIFAHLNHPAIKSLGRVGIEWRPIAGRNDLRTPTSGIDQFDSRYVPVEIPASPKNIGIFTDLIPLAASEMHL